MLKKLFFLILIPLYTYSAHSQTQVVTGIMNGKEYGVAYSLPKTVLEITIRAEKTVYTPGELAKYANRYLHLSDVALKPSSQWNLKQVELNLTAEPDSNKYYFVELKRKTVAPNLELTQDGIIKSINAPFTPSIPELKKSIEPSSTSYEDPKKYFTEDILMANSTAKIAELVAKEIYLIRESRNNLLRGEYEDTPADGEFLKVLLKNMEKQEKALLSMFTGTTSTEMSSTIIKIEPSDSEKSNIIARFSTAEGIVDSDNLIGAPIYLSVRDLKIQPLPTEDGKSKQEGIVYNLPGRGVVEVKYQNRTISKGEFPITQFGAIEYLAPALFNKKSTIEVYFDPTTGGLLKVNQSND